MKLYVWWLSSHDQNIRIGDGIMLQVAGAPDYLYREYRSLIGRPGRGRLWVAKQFEVDDIKWDDSKAFPLGLGMRGGIVIAESELALCKQMPGVVTDTELNLVADNREIGY